MKNFLLLFIIALGSTCVFSQSDGTSWTVDYSRSKSFIENKGQFDKYENEITGEIKYAVDFGFSQIFFGKDGVSYSFNQIKKKSKEEREEIMSGASRTFENHKQKERLSGKFLIRQDEVNMQWVSPSSGVQLIGSNESQDYHSYSFTDKENVSSSVNHVKGFEKIVYKNVYPNIDIEYIVHPEIGVKYAFVLHSGADPKDIQMLYDRDVRIENGEVHISTLFGDIIDHAPISFYENDMEDIVSSSFKAKGQKISFNLGNYDGSRTLVIDPWVQTPNDPNSNWDVVWELDKDLAGNVYVIAGIMPMQLLKYNSTGALQWTHNTPYDTTAWLGTMATDNVGNSYVTNGTGYMIQKIDVAGNLVWNNTNPSGGQISTEFWNISFNCDETKLLVGGTGGNLDIHGRVYDIDMNSGDINSSVPVTSPGNLFSIPPDLQEVRAMCAAPNGKYYFVTLDTIGYLSDNLTLCPGGSTSLFLDDHGIGWGYKSENWRYNNTGIKAIRADDNFVYVNKGDQIQKRSLIDGSVVLSAAIPGGTLQSVFLAGNQSHNAGTDVDDCGNIYVGSTNGVHKFDQSLNLVASYATTFNVYDVRVTTNGDIIACGGTGTSSSSNRSGGVQSFAASACNPIAITCCDATICIPATLCETDPPIALTTASAGGTWSGTGVDAGGNFDPSVSGAGTFNITYTLPCGSETIAITVDPCATIDICEETGGSLTASGGSGVYTWYTGTVNPATAITSEQECIDCISATPQYIGFPPFAVYTGCDISTCPSDTTWTQYATGATTPAPSSYPILITDGSGASTIINNAGELVPCTGNPCLGVTITMNIVSQSDPNCFGGNDGSAMVSASGGTAAYSYVWTPGLLTGATQSTLSAGTYSIAIQDAVGCTGSGTVTLGEPTELIASASSTPATCGANDGTATGSATGGTGSYTYSWSPSGGTNQTATGLAANTYTVTVTDQNSCTSDAIIAVTTTNGPTISLDNSSDALCFGGDGSATVSATGGSPAYTFNWTPGGLTGATQSALSAGSYTVTVTDQGGCTDAIVVNINEPTELIASASSTPATCGANDGTATGSATGGTGSYTYSWSPSGGTNQTATGLAANTYTVTVTDQNGCTSDAIIAVTTTNGPTISLDNSSDALCFGGDGSATVSATGGSPAYTFDWTPGGLTGATQSALSAGSYTVTVTDQGGCTDAIVVNINEPTELIASASSTPATCGANDGTATGSATGGTGSYTYSWSPSGGTNQTATGLAANTYTVTVTDQNGCTSDAIIAVTTTNGPTISLDNSSDALCFGGDGSATVSATGGSPAYTFNWTPGGLTGATQSALSAGSYTVTVTDQGGCTDAIVININEPTELIIDTTNIVLANCGANDGGGTVLATGGTGSYTYAWSPTGGTNPTATGLAGGSYTVTVTDQNNCSDAISFTIPTLGGPTVSVLSSTDVSCFGLSDGEASVDAAGGTAPYSYVWVPSGGTNATATGLTAGTYTVTVTDNAGCANSVSVTIGEPTEILVTEIITDENCGQSDGEISLSVSGGSPAYTYVWTPGLETTSSITGISGGSYSVTVTDGNGCSITENYTVATVGSIPVIASPTTSTIISGESVQLLATGADTYVWTPTEGLDCSTCDNPLASPTITTSYIVVGTDANGCTGTDTVTIYVEITCGDLYVPNIFSPNGIGPAANETLCIYGDCIAELQYAVYNRWGELVFETNSTDICWDGTFKGKPAITGVYAYKLYVELFNGEVIEESGNVTLVR